MLYRRKMAKVKLIQELVFEVNYRKTKEKRKGKEIKRSEKEKEN